MRAIKQKTVRTTRFKCLYCLLMLLVLFMVEIDGQFFTKSSKSIPRMGRRSLPEPSLAKRMSQYRRSLIDALVDEYGPNLSSRLEQARENDVGTLGGEYSDGNYQPPFDESYLNAGQPEASSRDERSSSFSDHSQKSRQSASLAMRALDANRYIQHLASGLSPTSFESLVENLRERPQTNGSSENI